MHYNLGEPPEFDQEPPSDEPARPTDPYGHLTWTIGNADDFHCFDVEMLDDGRIVLHSVVNSETGSFIQDARYEVVRPEYAEKLAREMLDAAWEWTYDPEPIDMRGSVRHSKHSDTSFMRAVREAVFRSQESKIQYQPDGVQRCHACHRRIGEGVLSHRTGGWLYHARHMPL
ncbi:MAG TPA: hypothetical protein VFB50_14005 [Chloroflexota bacterium]|nr:hypothetical protein [Chloroflexota bacterium]